MPEIVNIMSAYIPYNRFVIPKIAKKSGMASMIFGNCLFSIMNNPKVKMVVGQGALRIGALGKFRPEKIPTTGYTTRANTIKNTPIIL
ncbi:MAG TPA: hypothetical protein VK436_06230 [Methanocella sp.]|nr:hypothetical protein [Methanocella sp.]